MGYGPVGAVLAALLGQQGVQVIVLERYEKPYQLARAGAFDGETMRTFQHLGVAEQVLPGVNVQRGYVWVNGRDEVLLDVRFDNPGDSGWPNQYMVYQPYLESVLHRRVDGLPEIGVRRSVSVVRVEQDEVSAAAVLADGSRVRARYLVGCDGGNSVVRRAIGSSSSDLGFSENWLVCDFELLRPVPGLPPFTQVCNPAGPIAIVNIGPKHHRFSYRLEPWEVHQKELIDEQRIWQRVAAYLTSEDARQCRVAHYVFESRTADSWQDGRILLAGDAAHQMPPFLGQGMVSGIRDARNLAWKLSAVLRGAAEKLLQTYQEERRPHVRVITEKAVELGRVQTMRDPIQAEARDRTMLAARAARSKPDSFDYPPLSGGLLGPGGGAIFPQGLVSDVSHTALMDDVVPDGWLLVARSPEVLEPLDDTIRIAFAALGGTIATFGVDHTFGDAPDLSDTGGVYGRWFDAVDAVAAVVRPDSYVFGTARTANHVTALLTELLSAMEAQAGSGARSAQFEISEA